MSGYDGGAGASIYNRYTATNTTTSLADCSFTNTTSGYEGGGASISCGTATNTTTSLADDIADADGNLDFIDSEEEWRLHDESE